jgi:hypothetical protein
MAEQELFHIQLHPNVDREAVEYAKKGLAQTGAIGLDFNRVILKRRRLGGKPVSSFSDADCKALWPARGSATRLMQLCALKAGTIGLVRGGVTPVALVEITGPSFYAKKNRTWGWYPYRYPVQILGWYDEDMERWPGIRFKPPAPGTFQLLKGKSKVRKAIQKWLDHIGHIGRAGGDGDQGKSTSSSDDNFADNDETEFPEGKVLYRKHRARERSAKLAQLAKARAMKQDGRLVCKACGFDFSKKYGSVGHGYIECHHTLPVSELKPNQRTKLNDVALLCSNCHRMVHRRRPWLGMSALSRLLAR